MLIEEPFGSWLLLVGRIALASVYLVSGIHKAFWYRLAQEEFTGAGVKWIPMMLPATIVLHLVGSICLILGIQVEIAALLLAVFTALATLQVHAYWRLPEEEQLGRSRVANANLGLVGGLLILAVAGPGAFALVL